jgi:hypothetical protein
MISAEDITDYDPDAHPEMPNRPAWVPPLPKPEITDKRQVKLVRASDITMLPTWWLWENRIPFGELSLLAGRENLGKSTTAAQLIAWITTGTMKGKYFGQPKSVMVAASEDDWARTIVPRLTGAGADLTRVFQIEVETTVTIKRGKRKADGGVEEETKTEVLGGELILPKDVEAMTILAEQEDVALLVLDPLMTRLDPKLDSHRDAEVRQALEPMAKWAHQTGVSVLGLIHVNKGTGGDVMNTIMGSRAFTAVPRAVLVAMRDPEDEDLRLLGLAKSNLGRADVPTYSYRIVGKDVGTTPEGETITTGVIEWIGKSPQTIHEAYSAGADSDSATQTVEAAAWLEDYLRGHGDRQASADIKAAAKAAGHSESSLHRARRRLKLKMEMVGYPRISYWEMPWGANEPTTIPTPPTAAPGWIPGDGEPF